MRKNPRFLYSRRAGITALMILAASLATTATAAAPTNDVRQSLSQAEAVDDGVPVIDSRLHIAGNLRLGVSNDGLFGQPHRLAIPDNGEQSDPVPNSESPFFEFPAGTHSQHLYEAGLWIGGFIDGDTLVSTALDARTVEIREFNGFEPLRVSSNLEASEFYSPTAESQQQFDGRFSDTMEVSNGELDNRPYQPLGLAVTQTSHAWLSEPYDDFIIIDNTIRNISDRAITDVYVGVCSDADIYTKLPSEEQHTGGFADDVSGYLADAAIAYAMDNDGDPVAGAAWDSTSARSAYAVVPIATEPAPCCTTFNWWTIGVSNPLPFGAGEPWDPPVGDRNTYRAMATDSIGTDQLFIAASEAGPPRDPRSRFDGLAAGSDTRFVLALGRFDLQPGDSIRFVYALVAGDSIHQDPENFATNFDPEHPQPFYDKLYFGDLIRNAEAARLIFNNGFDLIGGAPPVASFKPLSDHSVEIHWAAAPFQDVSGYRIYRRAEGQLEWERLGETVGADLLYYTDRDLSLQPTYEYAIAAVDTDGQEGYKSRPFEYRSGLPPVIPSIEVVQDKMDVTIKWSVVTPKATFAPLEYINIYRRSGEDSATLRATLPVFSPRSSTRIGPGDQLAAGIGPRFPMRPPVTLHGDFHDDEVESGIEYWYSASVTNTLGIEGRRSDTGYALPMALARPVIVNFDDVYITDWPLMLNMQASAEFYADWAGGHGFDFGTMRHAPYPAPHDEYGRVNLETLAHYQCAIFTWETSAPHEPEGYLSDYIEKYLAGGGKCIFIGRNVPSRFASRRWGVSTTAQHAFLESEFPARVLSIHKATVEGVNDWWGWSGWPPFDECHASIQFARAESVDPVYPDLMPLPGSSPESTIEKYSDVCHIEGGGGIAMVGAIDSAADIRVLYAYGAGFPDTSSFQGKPVAIRGTNPDAQYILFNFPLSLMEREAAFQTLDAALADLGITTKDVHASHPPTLQDILDYIYHRASQPPNAAYDTNRDGVIDLRDVVQMIAGK